MLQPASPQEMVLARRFTDMPKAIDELRNYDWNTLISSNSTPRCRLALEVIASHALDSESALHEKAHGWIQGVVDKGALDAVFLLEAQLSYETRKLVWEYYIDKYRTSASAQCLFEAMSDGRRYTWHYIVSRCASANVSNMPPEDMPHIFEVCYRTMNSPRPCDTVGTIRHFAEDPRLGEWKFILHQILLKALERPDEVLEIMGERMDIFAKAIVFGIEMLTNMSMHCHDIDRSDTFHTLMQAVVDYIAAEADAGLAQEACRVIGERPWFNIDRTSILPLVDLAILDTESQQDNHLALRASNKELHAFIDLLPPAQAARYLADYIDYRSNENTLRVNSKIEYVREFVARSEIHPNEYSGVLSAELLFSIQIQGMQHVLDLSANIGADRIKPALQARLLDTPGILPSMTPAMTRDFASLTKDNNMAAGWLLHVCPVALYQAEYELKTEDVPFLFNVFGPHKPGGVSGENQQLLDSLIWGGKYRQWSEVVIQTLRKGNEWSGDILRSLGRVATSSSSDCSEEQRYRWFAEQIWQAIEGCDPKLFDQLVAMGWDVAQPNTPGYKYIRRLAAQPKFHELMPNDSDGVKPDIRESTAGFVKEHFVWFVAEEPYAADALWSQDEQLDLFFYSYRHHTSRRGIFTLHPPEFFERLILDNRRSRKRLLGWIIRNNHTASDMMLSWITYYEFTHDPRARRVAQRALDHTSKEVVLEAIKILSEQ